MTTLNAPVAIAPEFLTAIPKTKAGILIKVPIRLRNIDPVLKKTDPIKEFGLRILYNVGIIKFVKVILAPAMSNTKETVSAGEVTTNGITRTGICWCDPIQSLVLKNNQILFYLQFRYYGGTSVLQWVTENFPGSDGHPQSGCQYSGIEIPPNALNDKPSGDYYMNGSVMPA